MKIACVVLFACVCVAAALPSQDGTEKELVNMLNRVDSVESLPLFGGLRVERVQSSARAFGAGSAVESFADRAERYLQTHELSLTYPGEEQEEEEFAGRNMEGERK